MISNTKQNWIVGHTVKVGFLTLNVRAVVQTPGDWKPDAYILSNLVGDKLYSFVPHHGLEGITVAEAREMVEAQQELEDAQAAAEARQMHAINEVNAVFA